MTCIKGLAMSDTQDGVSATRNSAWHDASWQSWTPKRSWEQHWDPGTWDWQPQEWDWQESRNSHGWAWKSDPQLQTSSVQTAASSDYGSTVAQNSDDVDVAWLPRTSLLIDRPRTITLRLTSTSELVQQGFLEEGHALCFETAYQEVYKTANAILNDIIQHNAETVECVDVCRHDVFLEIRTSIQNAFGAGLRYTVAKYEPWRVWGVGIADEQQDREASAKLAICLAMVLDSQLYKHFTEKYPIFRGFCESHGLSNKAKSVVTDLAPMPGDICRYWSQGGYCRFAQRCQFSHSEVSMDLLPRRAIEVAGSIDTDAQVNTDTGSTGPAETEATTKAQANGVNVDASTSGPASPDASSVEPESRWRWWRPPERLWTHIFLHKRHPDFDLVPRLIGKGGGNMQDIYKKIRGTKLRIRGRGSGYLEVDGKTEAPVPLMLAVTSDKTDPCGFRKVLEMVELLLLKVADEYKQFCCRNKLAQPSAKEPLFSFGETSKDSEALLQDFLVKYPHPNDAKPCKQVTPGGIAPCVVNKSNSGNETSLHEAHQSQSRKPRKSKPVKTKTTAVDQCMPYPTTATSSALAQPAYMVVDPQFTWYYMQQQQQQFYYQCNVPNAENYYGDMYDGHNRMNPSREWMDDRVAHVTPTTDPDQKRIDQEEEAFKTVKEIWADGSIPYHGSAWGQKGLFPLVGQQPGSLAVDDKHKPSVSSAAGGICMAQLASIQQDPKVGHMDDEEVGISKIQNTKSLGP